MDGRKYMGIFGRGSCNRHDSKEEPSFGRLTGLDAKPENFLPVLHMDGNGANQDLGASVRHSPRFDSRMTVFPESVPTGSSQAFSLSLN